MTLLSDLIESGIVSLENPQAKVPRCRCLCGGECAVKSIHSHVHTKRHQKFLSQRNNPPLKPTTKKLTMSTDPELNHLMSLANLQRRMLHALGSLNEGSPEELISNRINVCVLADELIEAFPEASNFARIVKRKLAQYVEVPEMRDSAEFSAVYNKHM